MQTKLHYLKLYIWISTGCFLDRILTIKNNSKLLAKNEIKNIGEKKVSAAKTNKQNPHH